MQTCISILILSLLSISQLAAAPAHQDSLKQTLWNKKQALETEYQLVVKHPEAYYLVIDLPAGSLFLKAGAHILRICAIQEYRLTPGLSEKSQVVNLITRLDPETPEPGNGDLRLRGRRLPLDFVGRLIEGPREISRLYFSPALLIQAEELPPIQAASSIILKNADIKALGSALEPGCRAILIPPATTANRPSR